MNYLNYKTQSNSTVANTQLKSSFDIVNNNIVQSEPAAVTVSPKIEITMSPELVKSLDFIPARLLGNVKFDSVNPIIPNMLVPGLTLLAGCPKAGKSFLINEIGVSVASGKQAFGCLNVEQGTVVYVAFEDNYRRIQSRLHKIVDGDLPEKFIVTTSIATGEDSLEGIKNIHRQFPDCKVIVIDTLAKLRGNKVKGGSYQSDSNFLGALQEYALDNSICIVLVHHTKKNTTKDVFENVLGSQGLLGIADTIIVVETSTNRGESDRLIHVTGRDVESKSYAFNFNGCKWTLQGDGALYNFTKDEQALFTCLASGEDYCGKDLHDLLKSKFDYASSYAYFSRKLKEYCEKGLLTSKSLAGKKIYSLADHPDLQVFKGQQLMLES